MQDYEAQLEIMSTLDAEELQYLYVIANSEKVDSSGYHMQTTESERILSGDDFKIIVYDENGSAILIENKVVSETDLEKHLPR